MQTEYVCGFAFTRPQHPSPHSCWVLLIRKAKPDWMKGKLNGVGGKIEQGESVYEAQAREVLEETGITTTPDQWTLFHVERYLNARVFFNYTEITMTEIEGAIDHTFKTAERCVTREVWAARGQMNGSSDRRQETIYNLPYLLPMARTVMRTPHEHRPRFEVDPARDTFPFLAQTELERLRTIVGQVREAVRSA
jgi:hypothetical protein